jgi:hypothetical protein
MCRWQDGLNHLRRRNTTVDDDFASPAFRRHVQRVHDGSDVSRRVVSAVGKHSTNRRYRLSRSIRNRYPLCHSIPPRVMMLAREITAAATTPYDRARAIESYLRAFPYTLDLPAPPPQRDVADYFLFDLQKGYCDYYATAMVVMARAADLPARLGTGYAEGRYDINTARYTITEADAHSWVEVSSRRTAGRAERPAARLLNGHCRQKRLRLLKMAHSHRAAGERKQERARCGGRLCCGGLGARWRRPSRGRWLTAFGWDA